MGFTLIEVLISVAVSAIILTALYATFFGVFRAADASEAGLDKKIEAGRSLDRFGRDVRSAFVDGALEGAAFTARMKGGRMEVEFATVTGEYNGGLTPSSGLSVVRYFVGQSEGGEGGMGLYRESWDLFVRDKASVELLEGVDSLSFEFFDGRDWTGAWDSAHDGGPPRAVRVEVGLADGEKFFSTARVMRK